jgi:arginine/lysine/ornithine decarboxylase
VAALEALVDGAASMERPPRVEQVPVAEGGRPHRRRDRQPYPPGIPVLAPGERISQEAVDHLTTGVQAGMLVPGAADSSLGTLRVVAE